MNQSCLSCAEADAVLQELASVFFNGSGSDPGTAINAEEAERRLETQLRGADAKYRALLEQIPAVVFMANLDGGIGEAYVSPQIEESLGFTQAEWLQDPVRWYRQIHPEDKPRWSLEAAEMFVSGKPLRSAYRVIARDGRVVWFQCEARMIRREDGRPWFIHGVAFDISDLKRTQETLREERNVVSAILDTVGALVVVLDSQGRIIRLNRACERITGYLLSEVQGKPVWDLFMVPEEVERFKAIFKEPHAGQLPCEYENYWVTRDGARRLIAWSLTALPGTDVSPARIITTGIDITERKRLEKAILEISAREQRRIGQDLHDDLGQRLTGIAFLGKALEQKLAEKGLPEAADAAKLVALANDAINKTRELARGLIPVISEPCGLMTALERRARELEDLFGVICRFDCNQPVLIQDNDVATHLYHIVQEAVNNAIKHAQASHITIGLSANDDRGTLTIRDDGLGIQERPAIPEGMGQHIMNYRAKMIGGTLQVRRCIPQGTLITCLFPLELSRVNHDCDA